MRHFLLTAICLVLLLYATPEAVFAKQNESCIPAPRIMGPLHTSGANILDSQNHVVRFLGVNSPGMGSGIGQEWQPGADRFFFWATPEDRGVSATYDLIANYGFNVVRLLVSWANIEPNPPRLGPNGTIIHQWNERYLSEVDRIINEFGRRNVAIIISLHEWCWSPAFLNPINHVHGTGMPIWLYRGQQLTQSQGTRQFCFNQNPIFPGYTQQDGFIDTWKLLASRYANNNAVVAADMFNEAPQFGEFDLPGLYERIGRAILSVNPNLLLVFQESHSRFSIPRNPHLPNSVYAIHYYPPSWDQPNGDKPSEKQRIDQALERSRQWNVPLYIGEFGQFGGDDPQSYVPEMAKMMSYCKDNNISWTYFPFQAMMYGSIIQKNLHVKMPLVQVLQTGF